MKRIIALIQGKLEEAKAERRVTRVLKAVDTAKFNLEDDIAVLEEDLENTLESLCDTEDIHEAIQQAMDQLDSIRGMKETLTDLKTLEEKLNEDVKVEDDKK